ncbi:hypothetical protein [uncultured Piscinibacter sp.]|uniref:hypothetical protein n=1 Tax=uncultured Piscinibacter sp. TaxID=1131835 RepID=UPI00262D5509|nr:hypothetical protein [uncultured Piscinibacter sp.]
MASLAARKGRNAAYGGSGPIGSIVCISIGQEAPPPAPAVRADESAGDMTHIPEFGMRKGMP